MYCSKCGAELPDDSKFCNFCGKPIVLHQERNNAQKPSNDTGKQKSLKRKYLKIIGFSAIILLIIGIVSCFVFPRIIKFSNNTFAIGKAEKSVVKIVCYNSGGFETATGSGFVAFDSNTIITNYHVMEAAYTAKVLTDDNQTYEVKCIYNFDENKDIVILGIEKSDLQPLPLGSKVNMKKGATVTAIGSPLGIKNSISTGTFSGMYTDENNLEAIQFTAPISSGSSGGALFDEKGNVIGITYASLTEGQNLNLAIPIDYAKTLYDNISKTYMPKTCFNRDYDLSTYLDRYNNAEELSFNDAKHITKNYDNKLIKFVAIAIKDKNGYDNEYDFTSPIEPSEQNTIYVMGQGSFQESTIKHGDEVLVIGKFHFFGDNKNKYKYAYFDPVLVCKTSSVEAISEEN